MAFFVGVALIMVFAGVGFGFGRLASRMKSITGAAASSGRFGLGLSLIVFGTLVLTGLDHAVEAAMVAAMPDWLANAAAAL